MKSTRSIPVLYLLFEVSCWSSMNLSQRGLAEIKKKWFGLIKPLEDYTFLLLLWQSLNKPTRRLWVLSCRLIESAKRIQIMHRGWLNIEDLSFHFFFLALFVSLETSLSVLIPSNFVVCWPTVSELRPPPVFDCDHFPPISVAYRSCCYLIKKNNNNKLSEYLWRVSRNRY